MTIRSCPAQLSDGTFIMGDEANFENLYKLDFMQKYDDEERQLKSWRREKVNLSKIETDDPEMAAKIRALTLKIEEKEKELTEKYPSKGTVFLGKNPLTNSNQSRNLKKAQFTQLHDKGKKINSILKVFFN